MGTSLDANFGDGLDDGDDLAETHEINVTPFIDVILVLLIIFMIAAPLATVDVNVNLPGLTAEPQKRPDKPIFLTIKADHSLALGDNPVSRDELASALYAQTNGDKTQPIFLRADKSLPYGDFNLLRHSGFLKVALVGLETDKNQ
jgi:biopolymer transport protein ExbD